MRRILLITAMFLASAALKAQDFERREIDLDLFVQELFQLQDEDLNYEDLYESLFQYYRNPLNLNTASKEELSSLYVLSETQVNAFYAYVAANGKLLSIYELQAIPTFDLQTINRLLPFVTVEDFGINADRRTLFNRISGEDNNALFLRYERGLEEKRGFSAPGEDRDTTRYAGSPDKLYARYRVSHIRDFSLGFTAEKDAGEKLTWDPKTRRYGADFFSAHFQLYNKGIFKAIAIGDYNLQIGQGLILSSGFSAGTMWTHV
ncbi:MAG: helix-hairpin-helix domain-containing protein, partial [Chitinophagaceae bacterium]